MADTVKTLEDLIADDLVTRPNDGSFTTENLRNTAKSLYGCRAHLQETTLSNPEVLIQNTAAWTEFRTYTGPTPTGSPYTAASTTNTLTSSLTTGRITFPAAALGTYHIRYRFVVQPSTTTPGSIPDAIVSEIRKNGTTSIGGLDIAYIRNRPIYLPVSTTPFTTGTVTAYVGGHQFRYTATGLVLMAAAATNGTDFWDAIQVTNLGPSGGGSMTLFTSPKTTATGTTLTAGQARVFSFDKATASDMVVAAGDVLKVVATKNVAAPNLEIVAIRGNALENYNNEDLVYVLAGETEATISAAGDYVSVGAIAINTVAGFLKVRSAMFQAHRIGGLT